MSEAVPRGKSQARAGSSPLVPRACSSPQRRPRGQARAAPQTLAAAPRLRCPPLATPHLQPSAPAPCPFPGGPHSLPGRPPFPHASLPPPPPPREPWLAWYPANRGSHPCGGPGCDPRAWNPYGAGGDGAFTLVPCPGLRQVASRSGGLRVGSRGGKRRNIPLSPPKAASYC